MPAKFELGCLTISFFSLGELALNELRTIQTSESQFNSIYQHSFIFAFEIKDILLDTD